MSPIKDVGKKNKSIKRLTVQNEWKTKAKGRQNRTNEKCNLVKLPSLVENTVQGHL